MLSCNVVCCVSVTRFHRCFAVGRYFNERINIVCEFIPEMIFLFCIFGYLVILIFYKWIAYDADDASCAPSLLIGMVKVHCKRLQPKATCVFLPHHRDSGCHVLVWYWDWMRSAPHCHTNPSNRTYFNIPTCVGSHEVPQRGCVLHTWPYTYRLRGWRIDRTLYFFGNSTYMLSTALSCALHTYRMVSKFILCSLLHFVRKSWTASIQIELLFLQTASVNFDGKESFVDAKYCNVMAEFM